MRNTCPQAGGRAAVAVLVLILSLGCAAAIVAHTSQSEPLHFKGRDEHAPPVLRASPPPTDLAAGISRLATKPQLPSFVEEASAADQPTASLEVFDTGEPLSEPLLAQALAGKTGRTRVPPEDIAHRWASLKLAPQDWIRVPAEETAHQFQGDAVLANGRVMLVCRRGAAGAGLFGYGAEGPSLRALLAPPAAQNAARLKAVGLVEHSLGESALDATFQMPEGRQAVVRFELRAGAPFVKTTAAGGVDRLRIEAPSRFAVLPDFFADDIVVDAAALPGERVKLPSDNFLLHPVGGGQAIVLAVWNQRKEDVEVVLASRESARVIEASEIPYGAKGAVYVALLEGPGIWHSREVAQADADQVISLEWKTPFTAQWRVDFRKDDGLTDSWEMLLEKPDGSYHRPDWFGQGEADGTPDWLRPGRYRWTALLGGFLYPCWIDTQGQAYLQPLAKAGTCQGPALVYPLNRTAATPLWAFTVVDIMRATLGVGPCEYLLDLEGQEKEMVGVPTCVTAKKLDAIYSDKEQNQKRAEVEEALDNVLAFVRHIRARIEAYVAWGHEMRAYFEQEKKARPELAGFLQEMETLARSIDAAVAGRRGVIRAPEQTAELVEEFRSTLVGCDDRDAPEKCRKITFALREIGGHQDVLVGECREAVKLLRQRSALAMVTDSRTAPVAREIHSRTQAILRKPTSFEAPRR